MFVLASFGRISGRHRLGVFSFARTLPFGTLSLNTFGEKMIDELRGVSLFLCLEAFHDSRLKLSYSV